MLNILCTYHFAKMIPYLATRTDYAKGYKDGIEQAKVIVESIINEHNPDLLANN